MSHDSPDMFDNRPAQGQLFTEEDFRQPPKSYVDPAKIRRELQAMLADVQAAEDGSPWPYEKTRLNVLIFPQMANWLPPEERDRMRLEFAAEVKRLNLAR
jgi:hypothetical protein